MAGHRCMRPGFIGLPAHPSNENPAWCVGLSSQVDGINITEGAGFCQEFRIGRAGRRPRPCHRQSTDDCVEKVTFLKCVRLPKSSWRPTILLSKRTGGAAQKRSRHPVPPGVWFKKVTLLCAKFFVKALREERGDSRRLSPGNRGLFFLLFWNEERMIAAQ